MHSKLVQYFKECYQSDNREQGVWDIFTKNAEFLRLCDSYETSELYQGNGILVDSQYGTPLGSAIETYRREKAFIYCCHFLVGKMTLSSGLGGRARRICAPLVLFDAVLDITASSYRIALDLSSVRLNTNLFSRLVDDRDAVHHLDAVLDIEKLRSPNWMADWLNEHCDEISVTLLDESKAQVDNLKSLQSRASSKDFMLVPGGAMLLSKNALSSRGIIDELDTLSQSKTLSAPLAQLLLNEQCVKHAVKASCLDNIPGILSDAQSRGLKNAAEKTLSLIIGPPGTGKSYTIACMILERFMQGESVLVVSENEFAIDVVQEKLVENLGLSSNAIVRAGSRDYHKHLKQTIDDLTKGIGLDNPGESLWKQLLKIKKDIHRHERVFTTISRSAVSDGIFLDRYLQRGTRGNFFERFKVWRQRVRFQRYGLLYDLLQNIKQGHRERERVLSKHINNVYLQTIHEVLKHNRREIVHLNSALRARTSSRQEAIFSEVDYSILLKALPVWLCSFSSLHRALPLKEALFDLVIIDEATQCDIASCLPALYRAKRAVVVGDPKQLRHISFLPTKKQQVIQQKLGLDSIKGIELNYRDKSMIDFADEVVTSQSDVVMLDEHYRSLPEIIDFSNRMFYGSNLRIMTEKPVLHSSPPVEVIYVSGAKRVGGINLEEASAVISRLKCLVEEQIRVPDGYKSSIGVLSFFRDQAEKLQNLIFEEFDLTVITQHKLRAGTPYSFQGEERDIMLISCAVDDQSAGGTYLYLNRPDVFNVSVTRARSLQLVFISAEISGLPSNNLLRLFLESINKATAPKAADLLARDKNVEELSSLLQQQGMQVIRNYPIAGIPMDLVVIYGSHSIAIDLVGFPGEHKDPLHLDRYKIFERAGLPIFPISYSCWFYERDTIIEKIKTSFHLLGSKKLGGLSLLHSSSSWTKLLAINPELSKTVSALEFDLVENKLKQGVDQLEQVVDRYQKLIWVLNQKLDPNELTYSRYVTAAEDVFLGVIENLKTVVLIHKSLTVEALGTDFFDQQAEIQTNQKDSIERLLLTNVSAIVSIEEITLKWSKLNTSGDSSSEGFAESLKELDRLADMVEQYKVKRH